MPLSPSKVYLTRRFNGYYYVGFLEDGKRCWKSTRAHTKHEALQSVRDLQEFLKDRTKSVDFSKFTKEILQYASGIYRPLAIMIYKRTFQYFTSLHGDPSLAGLTLKHADDYKAARAGEVSAVSVNMELRALKAALSVAVSWGRCCPGNRLLSGAFPARNTFMRVPWTMRPCFSGSLWDTFPARSVWRLTGSPAGGPPLWTLIQPFRSTAHPALPVFSADWA